MQIALQVLFLLQLPCSFSIAETIPGFESNQPKKLQRSLNPRAIIAHCTPHKAEVIDETLDRIHILVEAGAWASNPERSPVSLAALDRTQYEFMRFFHTIDISARRLVQQRYEAIGRAIRNYRDRQSIVIRCDDPLNKCFSNPFPASLRRPGIPIYHFFPAPDAGSRPGLIQRKDIVICPRFSTLPAVPARSPTSLLSTSDPILLLRDTYSAHDRTSLLFIFLALNRAVWSPTFPLPLPYDIAQERILNPPEYLAFARVVVAEFLAEIRGRRFELDQKREEERENRGERREKRRPRRKGKSEEGTEEREERRQKREEGTEKG